MPRIKKQLTHLKQYAGRSNESDSESQIMDEGSNDSMNHWTSNNEGHHEEYLFESNSDGELEYEIEQDLNVDFQLLTEIIEFILDGNATRRNMSILVYSILK